MLRALPPSLWRRWTTRRFAAPNNGASRRRNQAGRPPASAGQRVSRRRRIFGATTYRSFDKAPQPPSVGRAQVWRSPARVWEAIGMDDIEHVIRRRAYELWEQAGCPEGRGDEFWHAARAEIEGERADEAPAGRARPPDRGAAGGRFPARKPGRAAGRAHRRAGGDRRPARRNAEPDPAPKAGRLRAALKTRPGAGRARPPRPCRAYLPIIDLALSGVIAVVGTVTVVGTLSAQSSRIDFAISIA